MLDPWTLMVASFCALLISSSFLFGIWRLNLGFRGIGITALAMGMLTSSYVFAILAGPEPLWIVFKLINLLVAASLCLFVVGIYTSLRASTPPLKLAAGVFAGFSLLYLILANNQEVSLVLLTLFSLSSFIALCLAPLGKGLRHYPTGGASLGIMSAIALAVLMVRGLSLQYETVRTLFGENWTHSLVIFTGLFLPFGFTLSIALLCNEKKEKHLQGLHYKAVAQSQMRARFLATMSHEIRTPLNGMMGLAQLIQQHTSDNKIKQDSQTIVDCGDMLCELANNVLDYSRLEHGVYPLECEDIAIREWLEGIQALILPLARQKNLALIMTCPPHVDNVYYFDHKKLRQVLINLLSNAIKFTPSGHVQLSVSLLKDTQQGHRVRFEVIDTGIGIPLNEQADLFLPFVQASNSHSDTHGSGLGLAINQQLLSLMNTKLEVESQPGQGSRFFFDIELESGDASLCVQSSCNQETDIATGLSILLIEDVLLNQKIAQAMLAQDAHSVTLARTGEQALDFASRDKYDLILLDINLPDISGEEVFKQIRKMGKNIDTPTLALTANVTTETLEKLTTVGIQSVVPKPIKQSQLRRAISHSRTHVGTIEIASDNSKLIFSPEPLAWLTMALSEQDVLAEVHHLPGQLGELLERANTAMQERKDDALIHALHQLSGKAAQFGLNVLAREAHLMEQQVLNKTPISSLDHLKRAMQTGLQQLHAHIEHTKEPV